MLLDALRQLWPVAAALALLDALVWVRAGRRLFVSRLGRRFAVRGPGVGLAGVLPSSRECAAGPAALLPAAEGVFLLPPGDADTPARFDPAAWTWAPSDGLDPRIDGSALKAAGRHLELGSAAEAEAGYALLAGLAGAQPRERKALAEAAAACALDLGEARERRRAFEAALRPAETCAWAFFLALFVLLPAVLYLGPPPPARALVPLVVGNLLAYAATLATAIRGLRRLRREKVLPAGSALAPLLLAPPAAVRAVAALGRDLLPGRDPLTLAALLLPPAGLLRLARAELHGAAQALAHPDGTEPWRRTWRRRRELVLALLRQAGIEPAEALAPPARRDPAATAWCPLCDVEVQGGDTACADCALPLQPYPPAA